MSRSVAKAAEKGEVFVPRSQEEYRDVQRRMVLGLEPDQPTGRPAQEDIVENLKKLDEDKLTMEEMMHWARQLDEHFRPKFAATPKYQKSEHDAHDEVLVDKGSNEFYCILCQKTCLGGPWAAQDTHCQSSMHRTACGSTRR
jgi:hypothetical protein